MLKSPGVQRSASIIDSFSGLALVLVWGSEFGGAGGGEGIPPPPPTGRGDGNPRRHLVIWGKLFGGAGGGGGMGMETRRHLVISQFFFGNRRFLVKFRYLQKLVRTALFGFQKKKNPLKVLQTNI